MPNAAKRTIHDISLEEEEVENAVKIQELAVKAPVSKKSKNSLNVRFDSVDVFYFDRQQGFSCIPSNGSNTVGMASKHANHEKYTLEEYLSHKRIIHLNVVQSDKQAKSILINNLKFKNGTESDSNSSEDVDNYDLTADSALLDITMDLPINTELFCPILTPAERTRIIKLNSDEAIDDSESHEITKIRKSREHCGCTCKDVCEKETCLCIINGIGCQLDKTRFPCGCSMRRCKNPFGLKRFDVKSVRNHYNKILYPEYYENEIIKDSVDAENDDADVKKKSNKRGRKRKAGSSGGTRKRRRSTSSSAAKKIKTVTVDIGSNTSAGSSSSSSSDDNDNSASIKCLDKLPCDQAFVFKEITI